jgi:hypothetical protein
LDTYLIGIRDPAGYRAADAAAVAGWVEIGRAEVGELVQEVIVRLASSPPRCL